ncbi:hypothetical protein C900_04497 [Fulvivirga imtechensis AK7]|uniref:DinB-like domain-containing protein n=1 Tax=Fulvivirga imtechensis AK7 TaxID=1237149 RepID=L8JR51_9BACT|nr:hypothetical protein [Fulvivirga imtechensis]ELR69974.1 hypothetical protein C900_04497 [Fulvivirga imtechensis AK7]
MKLAEACKDVLEQLAVVVREIDQEDFVKPVDLLNNSTIGQHVRHTLEFFICLKENFSTGVVNYDGRNHDQIIESDKFAALGVIYDINTFLDTHQQDTPLHLVVNYDLSHDGIENISTNYFRELSYNIEHAIHHMAIIKIGLKIAAPYVSIPSHFGVAVSTIKFQRAQIQSPDNT